MIKRILLHRRFLKLLKKCIAGVRNQIIVLFLFILFITGINIYLPHLFGKLADLYTKGELKSTFIFLIIGLYLVKLVIQYFVSYYTNYFSGFISLELKTVLINKYIYTKHIHTEFIKSGDFHQRLFNETGMLQGKLIFGTIYFIKDIIFFGLLLINIFLISSILFFDLLFFSLILYFFHLKINNKVESINYNVQAGNARLSNYFLEILNGKRDILVFNLVNKVVKVVQNITNKLKTEIRLNSIYQGMADVFLEILIVLFTVSLVVILVLQEMPLSKIVTTVGFIVFLIWPLRSINTYLMSLHVIMPSIGRVEEVLKKMEISPLERKNTLLNSKSHISVEIRDVSFSHDESKVFSGKSLLFSKRAYLILGENGSGKSTLANLILGILSPSGGEIIIKAKRISNVSALVSQEPFLYDDTIKENLKVKDTVNEEYLKSLLERYNLTKIFDLDLEKRVGENGKNLSGGEKQIISILRGVIKNPDILILDEITNNLSLNTYSGLIEKILADRKDKLTILMSHHVIDTTLFDEVIKL